MPSSQAAAVERRNDRMMTHEPPKLKTTLKTPPKQATNPLQFVKVGPCSLYRSAQEQLSKVQEVKKVKQEVREEAEDWQSNLDNWKSSRRKRQEHIIERVVEVKKLELEEHDRQRRRSKTFSEMMEERGSRGRKLSMSLAMYHEEDSNDLSDLGIGTSSGKSSVSGDTHDDTQSVLSDRDSEIDKNHSDLDNVPSDNGNIENNNIQATKKSSIIESTTKLPIENEFFSDHEQREYDSGTTATVSSPEPEEYSYESAIRNYESRATINLPGQTHIAIDTKLADQLNRSILFEEKNSSIEDTEEVPVVKVDILKRREIFEKASQKNNTDYKMNNSSNRSSGDFSNSKSIKDRLSSLEKFKYEEESIADKNIMSVNRLSGDMSSIQERLSYLEKQTIEREAKILCKPSIDELEPVMPLRERLSTLEKYGAMSSGDSSRISTNVRINDRCIEIEKKPVDKQILRFNNNENSTPSERSSSPDSEYRAHRAAFHRSLDSLDADASSGPDTFERVQSLEGLDYTRRYAPSGSSAELLHDTDREDSGIHTADVSCSVSQADEPVDEEIVHEQGSSILETQKIEVRQLDEIPESSQAETEMSEGELEKIQIQGKIDSEMQLAVITEDTAVAENLSINKTQTQQNSPAPTTSSIHPSKFSTGRTVVYQSPRVPPRQNPPDEKSGNLDNPLEIQVPESITSTEAEEIELKNPASPVKETSCVNKPSKIPTPLPRKSINVKSNLSISPTLITPPTSPGKIIAQPKLNFKSPSKIPSPLKIQQDEFSQSDSCSSSERRHTVIEESIVIGSSSGVDKEVELVELPAESSPVEHEEELQTNESSVDIHVVELSAPIVRTKVGKEEEEEDEEEEVEAKIEKNSTRETNLLTFEIPFIEQNTMEFIGSLSPLSKQIPQFNLTSNEEIVTGLTFPLGPPSSVEPPKEKPPPPPTDFSDEENQPIEPLKRLNSTRRIKKELRTRRSDFLGIEGINDDDLEFSLAKPPDMAAILAEERRIEQLHRRSYDTDSNYEQDSSHERDSGVELGHAEDWVKQPVSPDMSQHSRQSSEPFGASVTSSEEDEISKKEREIIEALEKEEQWRYGNDREQNSDIGEKLAHKLRELEEEKMQLERERAYEAKLHRQEEKLRQNEENSRKQEDKILRAQQEQEMDMLQEENELSEEEEELGNKAEQLRLHEEMMEKERRTADIRRQEEIRRRSMEDQLREQEKKLQFHDDEYSSGDVLRVERELLQLEQEELKRQRTNLAYREHKQQQLVEQLEEQWQSLQDVANTSSNNSHATYQNINVVNYRSSMPNLQLQDGQRRRLPPPPIPPVKPHRLLEQKQRDVTIRNSRVPSADNIPQQVEASIRHSVSVTALATHGSQQMTKQTLQALSAVPRPRIVKGDQWVQRRKSDGPRVAQDVNYQHWLIQEAEQRRINEKNQRSPTRKSQQHVTGTSVPYTAISTKSDGKPLPDSIIQTLTQRMQNRAQERPPPPIRKRSEINTSQEHLPNANHQAMIHQKVHQLPGSSSADSQEKMLSVSGKKKCSHCGDELGRGAAMIIESLRLFYHMECFKCCVCHVRLGDGLMGTDVRVRNHKLHCHNCYSSDDGVKFSCV